MQFKIYRKIPVLLVGIILLIGILYFFIRFKDGSTTSKRERRVKEQTFVLKNVQVSLKKGNKKGAVILSISNIPPGTKSIEYELTYSTKDKGIQGVIGSVDEFEGSYYTREIFLGTCSSGTCIRHKVDGPLSLLLRFKGTYGEEVLEKEFEIPGL
jgi:hypothetical protein